ncbi:MAG: ferrochelatase [Actinobacteria bacterium]|nr:ferrochelatase [Actinomycetota bacterium]
MATAAEPAPIDAVLLLSFGGPEGPDDVLPFLENVTRGRGIPAERLAEVAENYHLFGGRSPINDQNRELLDALRADFDAHGLGDLPIYWGNRNWHPYLEDTMRTMVADGVRNAVAFVTSAYSSYSGCRQYREDIATAQAAIGADAPQVGKIRAFFNHPGFVEPLIDRVRATLAEVPADLAADVELVFTAHSLPLASATSCDYEAQLRETMRLVLAGLDADYPHDLVWQSRSGPPQVPWLEPDVVAHLDAVAGRGRRAVVIVPVGFVSDHMEVIYDLDTQALARAAEIGLWARRAPTVGCDPAFVAMVRELVEERRATEPLRRALGVLGTRPDVCPLDCCPAPVRPTQQPGRPPGRPS